MTEIRAKSLEQVNGRTKGYIDEFLTAGSEFILEHTSLDWAIMPNFQVFSKGKVRDMYICRDIIVLITSDRQSAFDRQLTSVPYKGRVLNSLSLWWFHQTKDIVPNHVIASPHPNVTIARRCEVFPVEFVVRAYATGSTSTSLWTNYNQGVRVYCGHKLPDGLQKNQKLPQTLLTPTTKSDQHDALISAEEIVAKGLLSQEEWDICSEFAHRLFTFGQDKSLEHGLILVDTKYEFGRDIRTGEIVVVDELHTPDSSRFWIAETYKSRLERGEEPESVDKEFLRRWFVERCDPYRDAVLPTAPTDLVLELARRYILLFEVLTGEVFTDLLVARTGSETQSDEINKAVSHYFSTTSSDSFST